ncbi:MAG: hypothetical protein KDK70_37885, partial [Myxococcales bacterium]|nr:hypothetical protein [Myxococcales bacterium]
PTCAAIIASGSWGDEFFDRCEHAVEAVGRAGAGELGELARSVLGDVLAHQRRHCPPAPPGGP